MRSNELSDFNVGSSPMVSPGVMIEVITSMCLLVFKNNYAKQLRSVSAALKPYISLHIRRISLTRKERSSASLMHQYAGPLNSLFQLYQHTLMITCHISTSLSAGTWDVRQCSKTGKIETSGLFPLWDAISSSGGVMLDESLHVLP